MSKFVFSLDLSSIGLILFHDADSCSFSCLFLCLQEILGLVVPAERPSINLGVVLGVSLDRNDALVATVEDCVLALLPRKLENVFRRNLPTRPTTSRTLSSNPGSPATLNALNP